MPKIFDVVIVGTGPAGLTAAIYAARASLNPVIYAGLQPGGQLTTTTDVENFPGFRDGILGPELMKDMTAQAERFGTELIYKEITKVDLSCNPKKLYADGEEVLAKSVIIATGATAKTLGLPGEKELMGRGLSTCATCDGFFYRDKVVAVVGGGDSAMEEASYLAKLCKEVYLVHRRSEFRASPIMVKRVLDNPKITIKTPFELAETLADGSGVVGMRIRHLESGALESVTLDGIFYAIGHRPNSEVFLPYVAVDEHGYVLTESHTKTKTPGVFAAGDIADSTFRQAITAAGMGCQAAMQAQHYIENLET